MSNKLSPTLLTPCFTTEAQFEEAYKTSVFYINSNYLTEYQRHIAAMEHIANIAKSYILNNWKKVNNWKDLEITFTHGPTGKSIEYYNYVPPSREEMSNCSQIFKEIKKRIDRADKKRHNPLLEINDIVLDPTDGDFSITVNGGVQHWWIKDEEVIVLADYIEQQLKK